MDWSKHKRIIMKEAIDHGYLSNLIITGLCTRSEAVEALIDHSNPCLHERIETDLYYLVNPMTPDEVLDNPWSILYTKADGVDGRHLAEVYHEFGTFLYFHGMDLTQKDSKGNMVGSTPEIMEAISFYLQRPLEAPKAPIVDWTQWLKSISDGEGIVSISEYKDAIHYGAYILSLNDNWFSKKYLVPPNNDEPDVRGDRFVVQTNDMLVLKDMEAINPLLLHEDVRKLTKLAIIILWIGYGNPGKLDNMHRLLGYPSGTPQLPWKTYVERVQLFSSDIDKFYDTIRTFNNRPGYDFNGVAIYPDVNELSPTGILMSDLSPYYIQREVKLIDGNMVVKQTVNQEPGFKYLTMRQMHQNFVEIVRGSFPPGTA